MVASVEFLCLSKQSPVVFAEKKGEIDKLAEEYIANVKNLASAQRVEHLQKIQNAYSKCKEFSDDKVQLAMQTYEMVSLNTHFQNSPNFFLSIFIYQLFW